MWTTTFIVLGASWVVLMAAAIIFEDWIAG